MNKDCKINGSNCSLQRGLDGSVVQVRPDRAADDATQRTLQYQAANTFGMLLMCGMKMYKPLEQYTPACTWIYNQTSV